MATHERIYLDYAGTNLTTSEQLDAIVTSLKQLSLANPHSRHYSGQLTGDIVDAARRKILEFFGTSSKEYSVIFTGNTTHALKTVVENFDFGTKPNFEDEGKCVQTDLEYALNGRSTLMTFRDAHTSVIGLREIASCEQVIITESESLEEFLQSREKLSQNGDLHESNQSKNLFVMTAASNFCGRKYDLSMINRLQKVLGSNWAVCLDAAAWVGSSPLKLGDDCRPEFVAFSFYKMFGFPTGLAVLLVRNDRDYLLKKRYFGGGTIKYALLDQFQFEFKDQFYKRFEEGTLNFGSIVTLRHGFDDLERFGGIKKIQEHCMQLAERAYRMLTTKKHANGQPLAVIYGAGWKHINTPSLMSNQAPTVAFNLLRDDGSFVGFLEVEKMCDLFGIELRTGCFCNIGACASYLSLDSAMLEKYFLMGKSCGDETDLIDGKPIGADLDVFETMLDCCFLSSKPARGISSNTRLQSNFARLSNIFVYPVKSCAPIVPKRWKISNNGLLYDRNWMIVSANGTPMTQKRYPALCSIVTEIAQNQLVLKDRNSNRKPCVLPLSQNDSNVSEKIVCVNSLNTIDCGNNVSDWLKELHPSLADGARLVQIRDDEKRLYGLTGRLNEKRLRRTDVLDSYDSLNGELEKSDSNQNFSNQADFLLICKRSVEAIAERVGLDPETVMKRFRPNFVLEHAGDPFDEDHFKQLFIGSAKFEVVGKCTRCQMICIDQETGEKDPNILIALRDIRLGDKMTFGVYLKHAPTTIEQDIVVGNAVKIVRN
uniref:MOSC domain-containing protein n=1 Tax=Acrobeloides nanus TaxID=290746 RepID=A0A914DNL3_9BILA